MRISNFLFVADAKKVSFFKKHFLKIIHDFNIFELLNYKGLNSTYNILKKKEEYQYNLIAI